MPTTFPLQSSPLLHITFKAQFPQIRFKPTPAFFSNFFSKSATRINRCLGNLMLKFKDSAQTEHHSGMSPYVRPQSHRPRDRSVTPKQPPVTKKKRALSDHLARGWSYLISVNNMDEANVEVP